MSVCLFFSYVHFMNLQHSFYRIADYNRRSAGGVQGYGGVAQHMAPFELKLTHTHESLQIKDKVCKEIEKQTLLQDFIMRGHLDRPSNICL